MEVQKETFRVTDCPLSWLCWWFHDCIHLSRLTELWVHLLRINYTSIKVFKRTKRLSGHVKNWSNSSSFFFCLYDHGVIIGHCSFKTFHLNVRIHSTRVVGDMWTDMVLEFSELLSVQNQMIIKGKAIKICCFRACIYIIKTTVSSAIV